MKKTTIKILLVDDDPDVIEVLTYNLLKEGYQILTAKDGIEAIKQAKKNSPHLIIMDVMMPNMDGIQACDVLRGDKKFNSTIVMFLTARGEDYSHIAAFEAGADDYVTKPIKPKVLISKVKSLLRRSNALNKEEVINFKNIKIDKESYTVFHNNKKFSLPRKEFELLYLLASKSEKVVKRQLIMETIWGHDVVVGDRTIDVHIRKLREKLGHNYFKTIKGVGYKFIPN